MGMGGIARNARELQCRDGDNSQHCPIVGDVGDLSDVTRVWPRWRLEDPLAVHAGDAMKWPHTRTWLHS
jgi:hypothetical protein